MSQHPIQLSVTNLEHTSVQHLADEWAPVWAGVDTHEDAASHVAAAYRAACSNGFSGVVANLCAEDFALSFTTCVGDPISVTAQFVTATITCQGMRIELFDTNMVLSKNSESHRVAAYIRIHCSLIGLV